MWKFLYPSPAVNKRAKPDGNQTVLSGYCVNVRKVTVSQAQYGKYEYKEQNSDVSRESNNSLNWQTSS